MQEINLCQAATDGDLEALSAAIKTAGPRANNQTKAKTALVCAAAGNRVDALLLLLDWGVSADCEDDNKQRPLHVACSSGFSQVAQELLKRNADFKALDAENNSALTVAVNSKQLQCAKALLKAGAKLGPNDNQTAGLSKILAEVEIEAVVDQLKDFVANSDSITDDLVDADGKVWESQKDHMRLLTMREEQKAGNLVANLDHRLETEMECYLNVKKSEDALSKELSDLRANLQSVESSFGPMRSQIDATEASAKKAAEEEREGEVEYKAVTAALAKDQAEKDAVDRDVEMKEKARDEALAQVVGLQQEVNAVKLRNKDLAEELKAESAQLRGWERDKEAAAALTEKAHALLGTGPLSPKRAPPQTF